MGNKAGTLRQLRAVLSAATGELEMFCLRAQRVKEKLLTAQTDLSSQTPLPEESREQLGAKVAVVGKVQSRLVMREDELITMHNA